jgi:hypothetical protein
MDIIMDSPQLPVDFLHWVIAMLPIVVLLVLLVALRWKGIEAGPIGILTAAFIALLVFRAPIETLAVDGGKGLWDAVFILYVVWSALLLYLVTVRAGAFDALRRGFMGFSRNELFLVLASDMRPDEKVASRLGFRYVEMDELLASSDIITPHSAFNTREAVERILRTTVGNIASFSRGEPENVVSGHGK